MKQEDRQQKLDSVTKEIFLFSKNVLIIKDLFQNDKLFEKDVAVSSPFSNWRDALFHYQKMHDAAKAVVEAEAKLEKAAGVVTQAAKEKALEAVREEAKVVEAASAMFDKQYGSIREHLNRGLKDFLIFLCFNYYTKVLHQMIDSGAQVCTNDIINKLRPIYHELKDIVNTIRIGGMGMSHIDNIEATWLENVVASVGTLYSLIDANPSLKSLFESCAQSVVPDTASA